jgi:hypothetical protein
VAVPKAIAVGYVPIHSNPEDSCTSPTNAATLNTKGGKNRRNPEAAMRVIPKQSAKIISILIPINYFQISKAIISLSSAPIFIAPIQ